MENGIMRREDHTVIRPESRTGRLGKKGGSARRECRAEEKMPGRKRFRGRRYQDTQAYFIGQGVFYDLGMIERFRRQFWCRGIKPDGLHPILRFFHCATLTAVFGGSRCTKHFHGTTQEFQAGEGLQLTMRGRRQPEKSCQSKKNIAKTPHVLMDTRITKMFKFI